MYVKRREENKRMDGALRCTVAAVITHAAVVPRYSTVGQVGTTTLTIFGILRYMSTIVNVPGLRGTVLN